MTAIPARIARRRRARLVKEWAVPLLMLAAVVGALILHGAKFQP